MSLDEPLTTIVGDQAFTASLNSGALSVEPRDLQTTTQAAVGADVRFMLTPRDLLFVTAVPAVLGKEGITWFDVGPEDVVIRAEGDPLAFMHRTKALSLRSSSAGQTGFGVDARQLKSIARRALTQERPYCLDLALRGGEVVATPDRTVLTNGCPIESCLLGVPEDSAEQARWAFDNLDLWRLTPYFERPPEIAAQETLEELGPINPSALAQGLSSLQHLIPKTGKHPHLEVMELRDGWLYGGDEAAVGWCHIASLAGIDLRVGRERLAPLIHLLRLLQSRSCRLSRGNHFQILSDAHTTVRAALPKVQHPASITRLLEKRPDKGTCVNASAIRRKLDALRRGRGKNCPDAIVHAQVMRGEAPRLKLESRRWSDGEQNAKAGDLPLEAPGPEFDLLMPLASLERALAGCEGSVTLLAADRHLYVSARAHGISREVRVPAQAVKSRDRLARQIRQIPIVK